MTFVILNTSWSKRLLLKSFSVFVIIIFLKKSFFFKAETALRMVENNAWHCDSRRQMHEMKITCYCLVFKMLFLPFGNFPGCELTALQ